MVQATLQFIKTHLIVILCGVAGLAFISFAVLGMMSDRIKEEMSQRVSNARRMDSLKSNAKNEKMIAAEKAPRRALQPASMKRRSRKPIASTGTSR